jgi:hypothetical protein
MRYLSRTITRIHHDFNLIVSSALWLDSTCIGEDVSSLRCDGRRGIKIDRNHTSSASYLIEMSTIDGISFDYFSSNGITTISVTSLEDCRDLQDRMLSLQ